MTGPAVDLSLYLVVGECDIGARDLVDFVDCVVQNGVSVVQLREKALALDEQIALARRLKRRLEPYGVPLIINDHLEVALAAEADGLHLGQDDLSAEHARAALGPARLLGLSAGNRAEAAAVDLSLADYVGVGPVYPTASKPDAGAAIGLAGLRDLRRALALPMVAIGGIGEPQVSEVMACGVEGIAVVSALCAAADPALAAHHLRAAVDRGRGAAQLQS